MAFVTVTFICVLAFIALLVALPVQTNKVVSVDPEIHKITYLCHITNILLGMFYLGLSFWFIVLGKTFGII